MYRCGATLSSALNTAVRTRRIEFNPARYAVMNRPAAHERLCWTPRQAAAFLHHSAKTYADQYADIFEVHLGTGMRRGEALGLHWPDVRLARPRPRPAGTGSASPPASPQPSGAKPTAHEPHSPTRHPSKASSSPAPTAAPAPAVA
ncbi:hypothetical protein SCOCK_720007 [Actinacidiphila cocklensis]|uniref:Integrase n=1 Tax=Actinacidiphila cocklensis TaxID=887465 RepID=A0A9W4E396_9ACTN|nr:hypothetical protein SCOCK_720007 [Actinacidiphila cocklensis]